MNNSVSEAQIFALCESESQFPIDFDSAWRWIGYTQKNNAKRALLGCGFTEGLDLLINEQLGTLAVPAPEEQIFLTTDCFKMWAMMAGTEKGRETRKYFLECERKLKAIAANPIKKDWVLSDVLEHDMFAAAAMGMSMTFKSLAEEKSMERTSKEAMNYADLAHALFLTAMAAQPETDEPESDEDAEFTGAEEMDNLRWATMVRDSFATLHPAAAAKWLMAMVEKNPKSYYLKGLPGISAIPGYRQVVEIPAFPVIDRKEVALQARQEQFVVNDAATSAIERLKNLSDD
jgi:phage anti-repressor protein